MGDFIGSVTWYVICGIAAAGLIGLLIYMRKNADDDDE